MPLRFAFGIHLHQPVGNFDFVFEEHVRDVYRPLLSAIAEREFLPITVHISGPLLEWLEEHDAPMLDLVGSLAAEDRIELLASGMYEPVLVAVPRADRVEQVEWMRERLQSLFGVDARGAWLTERVWEQELAEDLSRAGIDYTLLDDRHFLVSGFQRGQLHRPLLTESDGRRLALFSIDEKLRYLIPFRAPQETVRYLRELRAAGQPLAVLADDGEKFGGWPGTRQWVYEDGWLERFFDAMEILIAGDELRLVTFSTALREVESGGLAYPPSASYREMEEWSLPTAASTRLTRLHRELGEDRMAGADGALVRGAHWRNFFVRYPEANRMQKKMVALSGLCRRRGDPEEARQALGRAQCNDAYWHGVFGGLYLPHLRQGVWRNLAAGERILRAGEGVASEWLDLDVDGHDELWVHGEQFSAIIAPHRGGAIEEYTVFSSGLNYADVLARRLEGYHLEALAGDGRGGYATTDKAPDGAPAPDLPTRDDSTSARTEDSIGSIHHQEPIILRAPPPVDLEGRALFVDRFLPGDLDQATYERAEFTPLRSLAGILCRCETSADGERIDVTCSFGPSADANAAGADGGTSDWWLHKRYSFDASGRFTVDYRWNVPTLPADAVFAPELSLAHPLGVRLSPDTDVWRWSIQTITQSERGLEWTRQGESVTPRWPAGLGAAMIELVPGADAPE